MSIKNTNINMMPIVLGDKSTYPPEAERFSHYMEKSIFKEGETCYLTIREGLVRRGQTQSSPGIHVEAGSGNSWGGNDWGGGRLSAGKGPGGMEIASSDGYLRFWPVEIEERDEFGGCRAPHGVDAVLTEPEKLYLMTDRTPHEAIPAFEDKHRWLYRLTGPYMTHWYASHSTPSPFGVIADAKIVTGNRYE